MNHRAKSPTPGLRPAFASPSRHNDVRGLGLETACAASTASQRNAARGLGQKSAAQSTASVTLKTVTVEVLGKIEILIAQARARIAAHDGLSGQVAQKVSRARGPAPLPSLTSAFATRRAVFGPVELDEQGGLI